ncbi:hypothetical protein CMUS01_13560 [Colletotrichum musicola]|uniref:NAD-dependent epimerase/dehydratase domain-containing protein n=1 Tax=Colletotrichum musicola TaxID=2175873 RepID=A0A8H6JBI4_9PEZI|nr:hypothetical protein CMUS01_13560 [Colletotrichum musicola]
MSVAIAGGTGGLGRATVEAIQARGTHEVIVLTRKVSGNPGGASGVRFIAVDYSNIDSLVSVLEDNNVETVISAVNNVAGDNSSELNLIRAAERSRPTKRFIPNFFGVPPLSESGVYASPKSASSATIPSPY